MKKRIKSFYYAGKGIKNLIKKESNARLHIVATILVISAGIIFNVSTIQWIIIILCIGAVFTTEALNTAIERLVDLVSPEYNKLAGEVKDIAAGAVLICSIAAAIAGLLIFIPKIINYDWIF